LVPFYGWAICPALEALAIGLAIYGTTFEWKTLRDLSHRVSSDLRRIVLDRIIEKNAGNPLSMISLDFYEDSHLVDVAIELSYRSINASILTEETHIRCAGGLTSPRSMLSVTSDGTKVDLWSIDDESGRQKWKLIQMPGMANCFHIIVHGGVPQDKIFLSCTADGKKTDLWSKDDASRRQRWMFIPIPGKLNTYHIMVAGGVSGKAFLSCSADGSTVDLFDRDDGSGRQQWIIG